MESDTEQSQSAVVPLLRLNYPFTACTAAETPNAFQWSAYVNHFSVARQLPKIAPPMGDFDII